MILHLVSSTCVTYAYKGCFCDIFPLLSSLFSAKILFSRIFLRRDSLNSKMQLSFSAQARNVIPFTNSPAPGPVNGLSWSPDGKYLAASIKRSGSGMQLLLALSSPTPAMIITKISRLPYYRSPGRPIASTLPQQARMSPSRFGRP